MKTLILLTILLSSILASAQTYTESILYNFGSVSGDGAQPNALVMDSSGNLYGTTEQGGDGAGTVYKLTGSGMETILHTFLGGADGSYPLASLTIDKSGNLYGTTYGSGTGPTGCGTVFKVTAAGQYLILHKFGGVKNKDGCNPSGPLTLDSAGNIYGTTSGGGSTSGSCNVGTSHGCGTLFKVTPKTETILYEFNGNIDGGYPLGNLIRDSQGNLYGVAPGVGANGGALFKVTAEGIESTVYNFSTNLLSPVSHYIARTASGNFYGGFDAGEGDSEDEGIWEFTGNNVESTYYFCVECSGYSTSGTVLGGPVLVSDGNLYGTCIYGGAFYTGSGTSGGGVVYEFDIATNSEILLYSFPNPTGSGTGSDGWNPTSGVIADSTGNFYGTTSVGGLYGQGVIFELVKN